jgi:putative mRNA 3-end processing factor
MRTLQILDWLEASRADAVHLHEAVLMRIRYDGGILVQDLLKEVILDPVRKTPGSIVSHGHMDHLTSGGIMTPETLEVLKVRRGGSGHPLPYGKEIDVNGFRVVLRDAGHVFGSAMVRVDDALYTGDFNPEGGATCGKARPEFVESLIVDATYGRPGYNFPPKQEVEADLLNWLEMELAQGPVALAGYEFGKSQELIALVNRLGVEVAVSDKIADLADIYVRHGIELAYRRLSGLSETERKEPRVYVLPPGWLRPPLDDSVSWLGGIGLRTAYVSGWCAMFDLTRRYGLDAQFPLSDHADFEDLMDFIRACRPRRVYTVFSNAKELAKAVDRRLRIRSEALLSR